MSERTVLRLRIHALTTEDGGRQGAFVDGYRGAISFGEHDDQGIPIVHDAIIVLEERTQLAPGETANARAWISTPQALPETLLEFDLVEGHRVIAHATALERLLDPTPFPLADLNDAKTRPLRSA